MREHEGGPPVRLETREEIGNDRFLAGVRHGRLVPWRARPERAVAPALPFARAQLVHADATADDEQPRPRGSVGTKAGERPHGAQERLLREVLCARLVDEGGAQPPDLLVGGIDETIKGAVVTGSSFERETGEDVHGATIGGLSPCAPGEPDDELPRR